VGSKRKQAVFPGASYDIAFDTNSRMLNQGDKIVATKGMEGGDESLLVTGCFVYRTIGVYHHTSFCYFYNVNESDIARPNVCDVGSDAG
jgi:hypothetical protein